MNPATVVSSDRGTVAEVLNASCYCRTLSPELLQRELERDSSDHELCRTIAQTRPHLFSSTAVFLSESVVQEIIDAVHAIERVIANPAYVHQALERAPAIASQSFGPQGVCMGYDFHISPLGPRLIEVNTNAGGLMLNAALRRAQVACCESMQEAMATPMSGDHLMRAMFDMFLSEWRLQRGDARLEQVAIVDEAPMAQYLAPEFELFKNMFLRHGISAVVVDPSELRLNEGRLWHGQKPVDLVYNRLTDFYLQSPSNLPLLRSWESGAVVLTPGPRAHALYADKRNLVALSDDSLLERWGVFSGDREILRTTIPKTRWVAPDLADELWAHRRSLFFKPVAGYGSKGAYRGDKITRRVWAEILAGDFVAQSIVPPGQRMVELDGVLTELKFDVRAYAYAGEVQLLAARMYAGQTTNFRTDGGGFAPVIAIRTPPRPHTSAAIRQA